MDLDVLPRGQVIFSSGVFVADIENGSKLVKRQETHWDLDADHLNAGLPLSIDTAGQPKAPEPFFIHLSFFVQEDASVEVEDVFLDDGVVDFVDEAEHVAGIV